MTTMMKWCVIVMMLAVTGCKTQPEQPARALAVGASSAPVAPPNDPVDVPDLSPEHESARPVRPFSVVSRAGDASSFLYTVEDATGAPVPMPSAVEEGVRNALYPSVIAEDFVVYDAPEHVIRVHEFDGRVFDTVTFSKYADTIWYGGTKEDTFLVFESQPTCLQDACLGNALRHRELLTWVTLEKGRAPSACTVALEVKPLLTCGSICSPVKLEVTGPHEARVLVSGGADDPGGDGSGPEVFETVVCVEQ